MPENFESGGKFIRNQAKKKKTLFEYLESLKIYIKIWDFDMHINKRNKTRDWGRKATIKTKIRLGKYIKEK